MHVGVWVTWLFTFNFLQSLARNFNSIFSMFLEHASVCLLKKLCNFACEIYGASLLSCSSAKPIVLRSYIQAFIISPFLFCCSATNLSSYSLTFLLISLTTFFLLWSFMPSSSSVGHVSFEFHLIAISFLFYFAVLASLSHELLGVGVTLADWSGTNVSYVTRKLVPSCLWKSSFGLPAASRRIRFLLSCEGWQAWLPACGLPHFPNYL